MNTLNQNGSVLNEKSVQEVSKQNPGHRAKSDMRHWQEKLFQPSYTRGGTTRYVAEWSIKLQYRGQRETFNLGTANKTAAAAKAKQIHTMLTSVAGGWDATLAKFKPDMNSKSLSTVGDFLEELKGHWSGNPKTFSDYCRSFRTIISQIFGIEGGKEKFNYATGGREKWVAKINRVKLARVTPKSVDKWRIAFVERAGENPVKQRRAKITCNSLMRQAKSLFAPDLLRHVTKHKPGTLPFDGVAFYPRESMRYRSMVDIETLIQNALGELAQEPLQIFLLATMGGLRRNEIDKLEWKAFRWDEGVIRIEETDYFTPKTTDSAGDVPVDQELMALFKGWHARVCGARFVIAADGEPRTGTRYTHYRAQEHFDTLLAWLRGKGVTTPKPLHELRKEFGSQLCAKYGIYAASTALRHTDIALTAAHYLDRKERVTVGLGKLLPETDKVIEGADFASNGDDTKGRKSAIAAMR